MQKLLSFLFLLLPGIASAQSLSRDQNFGNNGVAIHYESGRTSVVEDLVRQPDGKLLAGGMEYARDAEMYYRSFITRFLPDGTHDNSFGQNGSVRLETGNKNSIQAIRVQLDGKIVITGNETVIIENPGPPPSASIISRPFIARFKANGNLDSTFGENGVHHLGLLDGYADKELASLAILPDGRIVAGGSVMTSQAQLQMLVICLNGNGTYDNTFGTSGMATYTAETGKDAVLFDLVVQTNGKIVLAGYSGLANFLQFPDCRFAMIRINANGAPDAGFGIQGIVTTQISTTPNPGDMIYKVRLQADGKICAAGGASSNLALARYEVNGTLDLTFGQNGKIIHTGHPVPTGFEPGADKWYTCGSEMTETDSLHLVVSGFHANGKADTTVGPSGRLTTGAYLRNYTHAMMLQPDGKLVTGGSFEAQNGDQGSLLVRFTTSGTTGLPDLEQQLQVQLYPNPAKDFVTLFTDNQAISGFDAINILNTSGQSVYKGKQMGRKAVIPVGHLAAGLYLLQVQTKEGQRTIKFIKQ